MIIEAHLIISGMVQGVGFRYFAQRRATALGVCGFVRNLPDGNVEVIAQGSRSVLDAFLEEIRIGPRSADVRKVELVWNAEPGKYLQFDILA